MKAPRLPTLRVVCTTASPDDDEVVRYAEAQGWLAFRGDEEDVLERYLQAAVRHDVDFMVNVDGDDLFCSETMVDEVVTRYRRTGADYVKCEGLPFGGAPIGVKVAALREVCARKEETGTQGWGKYFVDSGLFRVETLAAPESLARPEYRMTLDYPEDLEFFRSVVRGLDPGHDRGPMLEEVVAYLDRHPEVAAISQQVSEQYWERFRREHADFRMRP